MVLRSFRGIFDMLEGQNVRILLHLQDCNGSDDHGEETALHFEASCTAVGVWSSGCLAGRGR